MTTGHNWSERALPTRPNCDTSASRSTPFRLLSDALPLQWATRLLTILRSRTRPELSSLRLVVRSQPTGRQTVQVLRSSRRWDRSRPALAEARTT